MKKPNEQNLKKITESIEWLDVELALENEMQKMRDTMNIPKNLSESEKGKIVTAKNEGYEALERFLRKMKFLGNKFDKKTQSYK